MAKLFVLSRPVSAEREDDYNKWYDEVHLAEVCAVEGIVAAQRFVAAAEQPVGEAPSPYIAIYEFEGDCQAALAAMLEASATFDMGDSIDLTQTQAFLMLEHGERFEP